MIVIVIAVVVAGALHLATRHGGDTVRPPPQPGRQLTDSTVPDVTGRDVQVAIQTLTAAALPMYPSQITVRMDSQPAGTVIDQNTSHDQPDRVLLTVSAGRHPQDNTLVVGSTCEFGDTPPNASLCVGGPVMVRISTVTTPSAG